MYWFTNLYVKLDTKRRLSCFGKRLFRCIHHVKMIGETSNLSAACSVGLLACWTFCRATFLMIKPEKQKHCDVLSLPEICNSKWSTAITQSTFSMTAPWIVSMRLLAKVSLWVKVLSLVWAASTSATLLSNARLNLWGIATVWENTALTVIQL